jgi:transitional endoplasmic reticulum ATPase
MDGLASRQNVIVIAATNIPNALDPALRRPGRFDREIVIPIPDRKGRQEILEIHSRGMPLAKDVRMEHLADITHGFVGADLEALCREAAMSCLRQIMGEIDYAQAGIPYETLAKLEVRMEDFLAALREIEPSAIREVFVESPNVRWEDVGGLSSLKEHLLEAVEWPLNHPELFEKAGVNPPKGILLVGPPGCGKTLLAKAIATESQTNFISVKGPALMSKWVGESEKGIREIFHKARQAAPCIIFFDEIDSLVPTRSSGSGDSHVSERLLSQFLAEFDGLDELRGVLVLAATNRRDMLDAAVLRPGRFDDIVEMTMPDRGEREEIFAVHLRNKPLAPDVDRLELASLTEGFSGADISAVARKAAMASVRRAVKALSKDESAKPEIVMLRVDLIDAIAEIRESAE